MPTSTTFAAPAAQAPSGSRASTKTLTVYRVATGVIVAVMLFSIYKMYTPDYDRMRLPHYLRSELVVAKLLGLVALVVPSVPLRVKEWAYAGFAIVLGSAVVAHMSSGDPIARSLEPVVFFGFLAASNVALHKLVAARASIG